MSDLLDRLQEPWTEPANSAEHEVQKLYKLCSLAAAELAALRQDAERYRKWRADFSGGKITDMLIDLADSDSPSEVDAAIDAAMAKETT